MCIPGNMKFSGQYHEYNFLVIMLTLLERLGSLVSPLSAPLCLLIMSADLEKVFLLTLYTDVPWQHRAPPCGFCPELP